MKTYLGLSVLFHVLLLIGLHFAKLESLPQAPEKTVFIDLPAMPPSVAKPEEDVVKAKQIAETEDADNNKLSKDAKYLSHRNQTVEKETKSKVVDSFKKGAVASQGGKGKNLSLKDLAPSGSDVLKPPSPEEIAVFREQQKKLAQLEKGDGREKSADSAEGSASNDYLADVKDGDRTMLNSKEFVYFGYYQRIKRSLEVAWTTKLRRTLEPYGVGGRSLASNNNFVTGLVVVLDRAGKVTAVQVLQRSGVKDLDQAAIDAFNQAGPFPDPPSGLVDENGEIRIPWSFVLQS